ncbi:hypothetical protein ACE6H2_013817 [Prunus campanulata]
MREDKEREMKRKRKREMMRKRERRKKRLTQWDIKVRTCDNENGKAKFTFWPTLPPLLNVVKNNVPTAMYAENMNTFKDVLKNNKRGRGRRRGRPNTT